MKVHPFRGYRFNPEKVGDVGDVVTQPYDKISEDLRRAYEEKSPYSVVRLIRPRPQEGDTEGSNAYSRAAALLEGWIGDDLLQRDEEPAFYAYFQTYTVDGEERTRKGFVGLGGLVDFSEGGVRPHEKTHSGPKADRLNLLRATRTNFGQIFMLYSDGENRINAVLDRYAAAPPLATALDEDGNLHRLWRVDGEDDVAAVQAVMDGRECFIADGHHRYETALNYRREMAEKGVRSPGVESPENRMMTFVNMDDPGLTILAGHRAVYDVTPGTMDGLLDRLASTFEVQDFPFSDADRGEVQRTFLSHLRSPKPGEHRIGLVLSGKEAFYVLSLEDEGSLDALIEGDHCAPWKRLDVSILHALILEPLLGIGDAQLDREEQVDFIRGADAAVDRTLAGEYQAVFLLNPTKVKEVRDVASQGERMPQKSTDFYPKLLTGLVFNRIDIEEA